MNHGRTETDLPIQCRRHRAQTEAWDASVEPTPSLSRHAGACEQCRAYDEDVVRMRRELQALAVEPAGDLWPAIQARLDTPRRLAPLPGRIALWPGRIALWPVVLLRAAGIVLGFGATLGALCALETWARTRGSVDPQHEDPFAAMREPAPDRSRVETAPELQLLALIASIGEERR